MEKQLHRSGLRDRCLRHKVIPAEHFSGDIVAASRSPGGHFYALLADATGHGLAAAISVLPVLALFYRMTKLNRSVQEIVLELNQQLKESMPVGRFVAVTLICLDEAARRGGSGSAARPKPSFSIAGAGLQPPSRRPTCHSASSIVRNWVACQTPSAGRRKARSYSAPTACSKQPTRITNNLVRRD